MPTSTPKATARRARAHRTQAQPFPFLKWAGGKRSLCETILARLPAQIDTYIEPFLGGGAVFLALARAGRLRRAVLGDRNPELVTTWRVVKADPEGLIAAIQALGEATDITFYQVRHAVSADPVAMAARMIWLNRNCFNGLYRLNRSGEFNVPFGRYALPPMINFENIRSCSAILRAVDAELVNDDFEPLLKRAEGPGCTIYCDPPYLPLSLTSSFVAYDRLPFGTAEHQRLADAFAAASARGVPGLLSNSGTDEARDLYAARRLTVDEVEVRRSISQTAAGRGMVRELLVATDALAVTAPPAPRA